MRTWQRGITICHYNRPKRPGILLSSALYTLQRNRFSWRAALAHVQEKTWSRISRSAAALSSSLLYAQRSSFANQGAKRCQPRSKEVANQGAKRWPTKEQKGGQPRSKEELTKEQRGSNQGLKRSLPRSKGEPTKEQRGGQPRSKEVANQGAKRSQPRSKEVAGKK